MSEPYSGGIPKAEKKDARLRSYPLRSGLIREVRRQTGTPLSSMTKVQPKRVPANPYSVKEVLEVERSSSSRLSFSDAHCSRDHLFDDLGAYWFGNKIIHAGRQAAVSFLPHRRRGHGNNGHVST